MDGWMDGWMDEVNGNKCPPDTNPYAHSSNRFFLSLGWIGGTGKVMGIEAIHGWIIEPAGSSVVVKFEANSRGDALGKPSLGG
jgi:hypothetical protein